MMEMEPIKSKGKDSKKLRLRALSREYNVYFKYFKSSFAKKVSYTQLMVAGIVTIAQISTMSLMRYKLVNEWSGAGIYSSVLVAFASGITLFACNKPTYCKLHSAMALSIISILAHITLLLGTFLEELPTLNQYLNDGIEENNRILNLAELQKRQIGYDSNGLPNDYDYDYINGDRTRNYHDRSDYTATPVAIGLIAANLILTAIIGLGGILQLLLSFTLAIYTGRAICCGRADLEGRFFELEGVTGRGSAVMQFRANANNTTKSGEKCCTPNEPGAKISVISEEAMDDVSLSSPPAYESGFFQSEVSKS